MEIDVQISASGSQRTMQNQATFLSDTDRFALLWESVGLANANRRDVRCYQERVIAIAEKWKKAMEKIEFWVIQPTYDNSYPLKDYFEVCGMNSQPAIEHGC